MGITVLNPFDGEPMKVRDNDAGRAVKDKQGRIFYVLPRSDGQGYYGATTRAGNPKEEQRAMELAAKVGQQQEYTQQVVHDKPVVKRSAIKAKLILLLILVVLALLAWAFFFGPLANNASSPTSTVEDVIPAVPPVGN